MRVALIVQETISVCSIDDLVTKRHAKEPYRMFLSRCRNIAFLLRQDNADRRLMVYGYRYAGLSLNNSGVNYRKRMCYYGNSHLYG